MTFWWHSINLGDRITPGHKSTDLLEREWNQLHFPDLQGKTFLDIGCWDGWFSFKAESLGARVTANDEYVWRYDLPAYTKAVTDGMSFADRNEFYNPRGYPGKVGFDTAHRALSSQVKCVVGDFMDTDLEPADIVLFSGVIYHCRDLFGALVRLRELTKELLVIESEAQDWNHQPLWEFVPDDRLANDASNWWVPSRQGLVAMCEAAGFTATPQTPFVGAEHHYRLVVHAVPKGV